jgi:hypothetical protein
MNHDQLQRSPDAVKIVRKLLDVREEHVGSLLAKLVRWTTSLKGQFDIEQPFHLPVSRRGKKTFTGIGKCWGVPIAPGEFAKKDAKASNQEDEASSSHKNRVHMPAPLPEEMVAARSQG